MLECTWNLNLAFFLEGTFISCKFFYLFDQRYQFPKNRSSCPMRIFHWSHRPIAYHMVVFRAFRSDHKMILRWPTPRRTCSYIYRSSTGEPCHRTTWFCWSRRSIQTELLRSSWLVLVVFQGYRMRALRNRQYRPCLHRLVMVLAYRFTKIAPSGALFAL